MDILRAPLEIIVGVLGGITCGYLSIFLTPPTTTANELEEETARVLAQQAKESCQLLKNDAYKDDLWMWDQDWETKDLKLKKIEKNSRKVNINKPINSKKKIKEPWDFDTLQEHFKPLIDTKKNMFKKQPVCPGYPSWYNSLCNKSTENEFVGPQDLTAGKAIVPKLLRLTWMGYPIHRHENEKWGYLTLDDEVSDIYEELDDAEGTSPHFSRSSLHRFLDETKHIETLKRTRADLDRAYDTPIGYPPEGKKKKTQEIKADDAIRLQEAPGCIFIRLPHKDGKENRVGNPLSKDFLDKVRDGILATQSGQLAEKVLSAAKSVSYWKSSQERIKTQMVVRLNHDNNNKDNKSDVAAIIPMIVPAGTLTRRAVERTWLTASNAKIDRIGSELKSMIQAPPKYCFVGADVDSQELWIAAVIGDAEFTGHHGSTALGWMTLQGSKANGTDMHSVVAKSIGITRDRAKIMNYGRIYGAGVPFAKQLLMLFNPLLNEQQASKSASKMYLETKGERTYVLNKFGAFCYALNLPSSSAATTKDYAAFQKRVISRKEMSQLVQIKRKLDMYVDFSESPITNPLSFELNDTAQILADEMDLDTDICQHSANGEFKEFSCLEHKITKGEYFKF